MGLLKLIMNEVKVLRGACPNCYEHSSSRREELPPYDRDFSFAETDDNEISAKETMTPWQERCNKCHYVRKEGEESDITYHGCSDDDAPIGTHITEWTEVWKGDELLGTTDEKT